MTKAVALDFEVERLIETVLGSGPGHVPPNQLREWVRKVHEFDCSDMQVLVIGGGTGLSTVVGGNSRRPDWVDRPDVGLKQLFPRLDVIVCTTDDGGSTGELLKQLPMIGIGDIRKLCLSMVDSETLATRYDLDDSQTQALIRLIHCVFNHRFPEGCHDDRGVADPLLVTPPSLRDACPQDLNDLLRSLGGFLTLEGDGPTVQIGGQCLGNLLLTAAIFRQTQGDYCHPPAMGRVMKGIDQVTQAIGARPGRIHPATETPGQLVFHYANGVKIQGQSKSSTSRRGFPVERVYSEFYASSSVSPEILRLIHDADLIIFAPGSLYTSSIPVLHIPGLADAIRENKTALKILGANLWVEEGETDIARRDNGRGFRVSELLEAYEHNVPGGCSGLFHYVLTANLENISGNILRNYALEGKRPIYLDRSNVEAMGVQPVESTIFATDHLNNSGVIQHDPTKFALAVRTLLFTRQEQERRKNKGEAPFSPPKDISYHPPLCRQMLLCDYHRQISNVLGKKRFSPNNLHATLLDLVWKNRDISVRHLDFIEGGRIVSASEWNRGTEWDSITGYYSLRDHHINIHEQALDDPRHMQASILIALGESLLGRYIKERIWLDTEEIRCLGARCYQMTLLPANERECFLTPAQLHEYLMLARMVPHPQDDDIYSITLNGNEGFLPPGLLFGLMYAWYLDNSCVPIMENEMTILHCREMQLIPHQAKEYRRKKALIDFFRDEIFGFSV